MLPGGYVRMVDLVMGRNDEFRQGAAAELKRLREEGPLESVDFEQLPGGPPDAQPGRGLPLPKEDKRSLKLLWHDGRVGIRARRHFRCVYDLAERVYPPGSPASATEYEDSWLLIGLSGSPQGLA